VATRSAEASRGSEPCRPSRGRWANTAPPCRQLAGRCPSIFLRSKRPERARSIHKQPIIGGGMFGGIGARRSHENAEIPGLFHTISNPSGEPVKIITYDSFLIIYWTVRAGTDPSSAAFACKRVRSADGLEHLCHRLCRSDSAGLFLARNNRAMHDAACVGIGHDPVHHSRVVPE
jgi:hypothetical protein